MIIKHIMQRKIIIILAFLFLFVYQQVMSQNSSFFDTIIISKKGANGKEWFFEANNNPQETHNFIDISQPDSVFKCRNIKIGLIRCFYYRLCYLEEAIQILFYSQKKFNKILESKILRLSICLSKSKTKVFFDFDSEKELKDYTVDSIFQAFNVDEEWVERIKTQFPTKSHCENISNNTGWNITLCMYSKTISYDEKISFDVFLKSKISQLEIDFISNHYSIIVNISNNKI